MREISERRKKIKKITVVIGALIIPLLYSFFYLGAFWDPYSRLDDVPVAVVNLDQGADINGAHRNLGEEVCDNLEKDGSLAFAFTDQETAKTGTEGNKYYASITIPKDFSQNVASAATTDKQQAKLEYAVNEKRNYLAAQILNSAIGQIEREVVANVDKELTGTLAKKLKEVPEALGTLSDGFTALYDGATRLSEGGAQLAAGTQELNTGSAQLAAGSGALAEGTNTLVSGSGSLNQGMDSLLSGITEINEKTANLDQLAAGVVTLDQGAKDLKQGIGQLSTKVNQGLNQYKEKVDLYVGGYQSLYQLAEQTGTLTMLSPQQQQQLAALNAGAAQMTPGYEAMMTQINGGFSQLSGGAEQLSVGTGRLAEGTAALPQLKQGLLDLQAGIQQAKGGSNMLYTGSLSLNSGARELSAGATKLNNGAGTLNAGMGTLNQGIGSLQEGIKTGKDGVDTNLSATKEQLKAVSGIEDYAARPINVVKDEVDHVPNYGTAFAPYFLSLSLWVGGLIIFFGIYLDVDKRYKYLCRDSENKVIRSFVYLLLGLAQAVVLSLVIKFGLGLEVENMATYILSCCLVSMVFVSIIQFCLVHLGDMGKFVALLLLILQLTSCGGTFPMETVPKLFNVLYPYMPMTYSVGLFKETITGATGGNLAMNIGVLVGIMIAAMTATILMTVMKKGARELRKMRKANQA
ncbi:MAG: YhgE/Pip domain-containing protein [Anaerovoracaceae bacterium]